MSDSTNETNQNSSKKPYLHSAPIDIEGVLADPDILKIYANGFTTGHSFVDATLIIQHGKSAVAAVSMPFASLKSLHRAIGETITKVEKGLGQPLPDVRELSITWNENLKKDLKQDNQL